MSNILLAGTADTKNDELQFVVARLRAAGISAMLVDLSTRPHTNPADISAESVAKHHPDGVDAVLGKGDRGAAVAAMRTAFANYCRAGRDTIAGVMGMGGGGGTAMITAGMRELPYGTPKLMVSTLASGDTAPYVDTSDIAMFPAVTDLAGLNSISRTILANAAAAFAGMVNADRIIEEDARPAVGMTMFGVTTLAVTQMVDLLKKKADCLVFHATGTGGRTMERLLSEGRLTGLIDLTTTEIADELCGGVLSAGAERLDAVAATSTPYVGAPGALDMVNFWGPQSVPERYRERTLYYHNPNVTLMRTNESECARLGAWIAGKLNACNGPVRFLVPEKGFSAIDIDDGPFWLPAANTSFIESLEKTLDQTENRRIMRYPLHINDAEFARAAVDQFLSISELR